MIVIAPQYTQLEYFWTQWKSVNEKKALVPQFIEEDNVIYIWGYDGPEVHLCKLWRGNVPEVLLEKYSQEQNNIDLTEFDSDLKPLCNMSLSTMVTVPKNQFELRTPGTDKAAFKGVDHVAAITLSNKVGSTYNYTCTLTPEEEDCVFTDLCLTRICIEEVGEGTITLEQELDEGTYTLTKHVHIDFVLPPTPEGFNFWHLWGVVVDIENYGRNDWVQLEVACPSIGLNIKKYSIRWVRLIQKITNLRTPDGYPGQIPPFVNIEAGSFPICLRIDYYPTEPKTDVTEFWYSYTLSTKDNS